MEFWKEAQISTLSVNEQTKKVELWKKAQNPTFSVKERKWNSGRRPSWRCGVGLKRWLRVMEEEVEEEEEEGEPSSLAPMLSGGGW